MEGPGRETPRDRPGCARPLAGGVERHRRRWFLRHLRRTGTCDPMRPGGRTGRQRTRDRGPSRSAHGRVRAPRGQVRGYHSLYRCSGGGEGRAVRGAGLPDREGPRRRLPSQLRGCGRLRVEGRPRPTAASPRSARTSVGQQHSRHIRAHSRTPGLPYYRGGMSEPPVDQPALPPTDQVAT